MKNFSVNLRIIIALLIFCPGPAAQAQWSWVNPLPQGNTLKDVQFVSNSTGFAVGDGGTILKTGDGGFTWNRTEGGSMDDLGSVFFLDSLTGYALANEWSSLFKTTDGGVTWTLNFFFNSFDMNDVWFTTPLHGVATGYESVFVTDDGGLTWSWNQPYSWNYSLWFTGLSTAFMCSDGALYKSYDAGNTWTVKHSYIDGWLGSFFFMNADTGIHVGRFGQIIRTIDAGEHWDSVYSGTANVLTSAYIHPTGTGYAVGYAGTMLRTTDAGASWLPMSPITDYNLESITFTSDNHGMIAGENGLLLMTDDGGLSWTFISSTVTRNTLNALVFPDQNTGYAAGTDATVLKTTNGGSSWQTLAIPDSIDLSALFFNDAQTGYVAGTHGSIYKTTNGGVSWNHLATGVNDDLTCIDFPSYATGYAIGADSQGFYDSTSLLKTTDAGNTWTTKPLHGIIAKTIAFTSPDTGYIAGNEGRIMKTTNGGISWTLQGSYSDMYYFKDLCFPTREKGFACGSHSIYQTTDAGLHWDTLYSGPLHFLRMVFPDSLNGYALALGPPSGEWRVFRTEDGGVTWCEKPVNQTRYGLSDLFFIDPENGFIVGDHGVILKTGNGGGIITGVQPGTLKTTSAVSIFPNPCHGLFQIDMKESRNSVSVQVYSILGQELFSASYPFIQKINIHLPSLQPGIYLVRIRSDKAQEVQRLVIGN